MVTPRTVIDHIRNQDRPKIEPAIDILLAALDERDEVIAKLRDALAEGTRVYADYGGRPDYAIEAIEAANAMLAGTKWGKP